MSVVRGSLINLATRILAVALGLAITLYTARLGRSEQGAFALFTAVESVLLALTSGFGVALARRISHHGEQPTGLVGASVLACAVLGMVAGAGLVAGSLWGGDGYRDLWLLALAGPLLFVTPNISGLWLGAGRMAALARVTLGAPVLTLLALVLLALAGAAPALRWVLLSWVAARMVVAAVVLRAAHRGGWMGAPDLSALKSERGFIVVIAMTNLVGLLNYKADLFLVEHFLGLAETGVYSIAVMIAELLWLVSSSVTTAAYARIGAPDADAARRITLLAVHASVLILVASSPVLWLCAAVAVPLLLGPDYVPAVQALGWLLPGVALYGAASALSAWFTNHAGRPRVPAQLATLSLVINVAVSLIAIPRIGMLGGALATSLSYAVTVVVAGLWFMRASGTSAAELLRPDWHALRAIGRRSRRAG